MRGAALRDRLSRWLLPSVGIAILIGLWWALSGVIGPLRLPSPVKVAGQFFPLLLHSDVLSTQFGGAGGIGQELLISLAKLAVGTGIGTVAGIGLGLAMCSIPTLSWLLEIPTALLRAIPPLALVPFILVWIGTGIVGELVLVTLYVMLINLANTVNAIQNVPAKYERYAATMGARNGAIFRTVLLPAIVPGLAGGLRITFAFAWGLLVVAESLGGRNGIGQVLTVMVSLFDATGIIVSVLWIVLISTLIDRVLLLSLHRLSRWSDHAPSGA